MCSKVKSKMKYGSQMSFFFFSFFFHAVVTPGAAPAGGPAWQCEPGSRPDHYREVHFPPQVQEGEEFPLSQVDAASPLLERYVRFQIAH